jgi:murein DD-endopeptidase MepM/ murein hydrolase activator NlpD
VIPVARAALGGLLATIACGCHHGARPPATPLTGHFHTVARGETLSQLSTRFAVPVDDLVELNALVDPDRVGEGTELFIPDAAPLPRRHRAGALSAASRSRPPAVIGSPPSAALAGTLLWPVEAPVTSPFGRREGYPHEGIDLGVPDGTAVRAAAAGQVVVAGERLSGYGRLLVVDHGDGLSTVYAHNSELLVAEGDRVASGQVIALSGHTGRVTAPHVHFEVRRDGEAVDPLPLLGARPAPR